MKRIIDRTPSELMNMSRTEFLEGIRASEGRTICAYVSPAAPNLIEYVSNIEACASFGADYINFQGYNPREMIMPGLPSKNSEDDREYRHLQMQIGKGWSIPELKKVCGRPLGGTLQVPDKLGGTFEGLNERAIYSDEYFKFMLDQGYDFLVLAGLTHETMIAATKEARGMAGEDVVLEVGTPHGPGNPDIASKVPYNLREYITTDYVKELVMAGADIVDIPAAGAIPGFTIEYVAELIDTIHSCKALAAVNIAHSIEGADENTISRLGIDNRSAGADIINLSAAGFFESMPLPETLQALCIAMKGKRYTYRRMCQSALR